MKKRAPVLLVLLLAQLFLLKNSHAFPISNSENDDNCVITGNFFEGFEGSVVPPPCWTAWDADGNVPAADAMDYSTAYYYAGRRSFYFQPYPSPQTLYLITPELNLTDNKILSFRHQSSALSSRYPPTYTVGISYTGNNISDFRWGITVTPSTDDSWIEHTQEIDPSVKYICIRYNPRSSSGSDVNGNTFNPDGLNGDGYTIRYSYTDPVTNCSNYCEFMINVSVGVDDFDFEEISTRLENGIYHLVVATEKKMLTQKIVISH